MLSCALESWSPTIGDPSVMGWVTVAVYVIAAIVSARVVLVGEFPEHLSEREESFWALLALLLILLALNKQLDLQSFLTAAARCLAQEQGWYQDRRSVQLAFIAAIAVLCLALAGGAALMLRKSLQRTWLAVTGLCILLGFVLIRAAGFHHMDRLINVEFQSIRMNWVLELSGLVLILIAGLRHPRQDGPAPR